MTTTLAMRPIERVITSQLAPVGTFTVRRALPDSARRSVGPFVFLDHFGPFAVPKGDEGVGPHPHAGIETVTYLLTGRNEHRDSAGHTGIVSTGGAQWMSAGRGIVHSERPLAEEGREVIQHGIQFWTSLPRALKMMPPRYQRIDAEAIPTRSLAGTSLRVIAGDFEGTKGPAETLMPTLLAHASVDPGATLELPVSDCYEIAAYVVEGEGDFGVDEPPRAELGDLVVFANGGGSVRVRNTGAKCLELMLLGGAPAEGPLVFHGPFVMNSIEQIRAAEIAYRTGRMGSLAPTT